MVIKNRSRICLIISGAIILIALILTLCGRGINMGIDFEGGLSMQYDLKTAAEKTDVETVLNGMDISSYTITVQGANNNEINIRIKDVAKDDIQIRLDQVTGFNTVKTRMRCQDLLCHRHTHSLVPP